MCEHVCAHPKLTRGYFISPAIPLGFDELTCHCGASVIYPPVPCGTRPPECTQTCARMHECDHPGEAPLPLHLTACSHLRIWEAAMSRLSAVMGAVMKVGLWSEPH